MKIMLFGYVFPSHKAVRDLLGIRPYMGRDADGKRRSIRNSLTEAAVMKSLGTDSRVEARRRLTALLKKSDGPVVIRME